LPYYVTLGGTVILGLDRRKLAAVLWRRKMPDFETRLKDVSHAAWLIWTANGFRLDDFELEQTSKSATDAANNAYVEGISDGIGWTTHSTPCACAAKAIPFSSRKT
jgi:hypothetical protein